MVNETITAQLGRPHPEDIPALQGCCPPPAGRERPLADERGEPLLPRVVQALVSGITLPSPANVVGTHERSVLDAGAAYPAIDPERLAEYQERGRRLQAIETGEVLGRGLTALGRGIGRLARHLRRLGARAFQPSTEDRLYARAYGLSHRPGALDVAPDYNERVARFYGRGL